MPHEPAGPRCAPPFDPELKASLAVVGGMFPPTVTPDLIRFMRHSYASRPVAESLADRAVVHNEYVIKGHCGDRVTVSVFSPADDMERPRPAILYAHSGGLMFGDRFNALDANLDWVEDLGAVLVCPEYRLAPEFPDPFAREDMYAALEWVASSPERLGVDPRRLMVAGASSGGGLAAGLALASRDRDGPALRGQLLSYPMLDDRGIAPSVTQFDGVGVWDRVSNETGWRASLGEAYRTESVSRYAAPARATDLRGLPPAFLDVGDCEIFRDETIAYATALWTSGVNAELHVWPGAFHACDIFAPHTSIAKAMLHTRSSWVERILSD
ncbi:alpha/beta hydrolase [Gordonia sp. OPL2]|uniref:alpha/beta hydrolase n=1 Tax=Gordonia sp. OPL2 TaxID=2486274 RepID=UPI0021CC5885|nr:alpha/beta hydrolase [Gordonia sp. OPL2]